MTLSELCIRRPVLATVINVIIIVMGLISYNQLTVREYPNTDAPVITVDTVFRGASAEIMESQITKVMEDALSGLEGIDYMSSVSRQERSQVTLTFKLDRAVDAAAADVRDRVSRVRGNLPDEIEEPIISKVEADAQPIIFLSFSSDRHSDLEVTDYAERYVQDRLRSLPGVAEVRLFGDRRYAMRIWIDRDRLAAYKLTPADIEQAIRRQNVEIPAGRVESTEREFTVSGETDLKTPEQFGDIVLRDDNGYLVKIKDVARVALGAEQERSRVRYDGKPAVAMGVVKQSTGNPIDVSDALDAVLPDIRKGLPEGMNVMVAYNSSIFIKFSIQKVFATIIEAIVFVALVVFFFLRSARITLIPLVTIPISLVGAFAVMSLLGFTINTLTLLSLVMAVGLVVDDAIVVLENIQRHIEEGVKPFQAAIQGSREIVFAVIAMSITLAAVYAPIAFIGGNTGKLFTEFALTLAGTVLISGWIALTLTPMMCARIMRGHEETQASESWFTRLQADRQRFRMVVTGAVIAAVLICFFMFGWLAAILLPALLALSWWMSADQDGLRIGYRNLLDAILDMRRFIVVVALVVGGIGVGLYMFMPQELAPSEDRSFFMGIAMAPEGSSVAYLDQYTREMENIYHSMPDALHYFMVAGFPNVNQAISFVLLKPWEERHTPAQAITGGLFPRFMGLPGILAFPVNPPPLGASARSQPISIIMQSSIDYREMEPIVNKVMAAAATNPNMFGLDSDLKLNKPEIRFDILRDKAALLGVDSTTIGLALQTLFGEARVTRFKRGIDQYEVIVQVSDDLRRVPNDLTSVYVRAASGEMVQLADLVRIQEVAAPRELNHFNKFRATTITGNTVPGYSLGEALKFLETEIQKAGGDKIRVDYGGISREFKKSGAAMLVAFGLALVFIYMVLAAQYESYRDPFTIMLSVPLAIAGALITLYIVGGSINIYSQIGLITLVGLITKHGILIVEFANKNREERGLSPMEAVAEAASVRLRPILMTTLATILGAMPLALSHGAGAESRQQIGWVIVGGMAFGTILTLFVVPVVYTFMAKKHLENHHDEQHAA
jgi:multidrug efflux pump